MIHDSDSDMQIWYLKIKMATQKHFQWLRYSVPYTLLCMCEAALYA